MPGGNGPRWARQDKPRDLRAAMAGLLVYMGRERRALYAGILCALAATVLSLIGPQLLASITDSISGSILGSTPVDIGYVSRLGAILVVLYAASFLLSVGETRIIGAASERIGDRMRRDLSVKIDRLPLSYLESHSIGDMMSRMTNDTDTVRTGAAESFSTAVSAVCMIGGGLAMMLYTDWRLAVVAVLPTLLGASFLYIVTHRSQKYFVAQQRDLGLINGIVEETYYGHDVVRTYNGTAEAERRFAEVNDRLRASSFRARVATAMMPQLMNFISNLSYVVVCVAGSVLIIEGSIGYGVIVAFIVYVKRFNQPVAEMADIVARMQSVASASERVFGILSMDEMPPSPEAPNIGRASGRVEFRDVRFGYTPGREVIHGFSLTVEPGSKVAIVGPTGAGKTTIANLLVRFYDPDSGEILIDGIPTTSMSRSQVREQFSMVLQDSWLSDGTFYENVAFTSGAGREEVERACDVVGIGDHIRSLPDGFDTVVGEASALSAGQRQQLAIARAMIKDAPMLILDEATSSVDTRTERRIQEAMDRMMVGRTSFVIAHRLSTVRDADVILVIRDGSIVEQGTHEELIALGGFYRMLYDSQFEGCD
ncbi:MAG TPA: ABC transporter ATP-binding protein/permease [Euryarchaeota archaeon]|nr:ABC transporter ATP-binding protein/permease [Euryarchaeota archaeon]